MPAETDGRRAVVRRGSQPSGALVVAALPLRHPRLTATVLLWALGLCIAFLARPPAITPEQMVAFKAKLKQAEGVLAELTVAERRLMDVEMDMQQYKVWFWRWKTEARREVEARQPALEAARKEVEGVVGRRDAILREAKAILGLWSEAGVEEGRELFWNSFASGKLFAQRQSFWDALFVIIGSRERDWLGMLLQLLFRTIMNFVTGMTVSVFVFLIRLPSLIWSYQPALWSAAAFFVLAAVAAISVVVSYLGLLVGAGATATYATLWMVAHQQQQRLEGGGAPRERIGYAAGGAHHED